MHIHWQHFRRSILTWSTAIATLVATLAIGVPAAWAAPTVTISAPQNGQTVTNPSLTVQGTVGNITGTASGSVSVNGGTAQSLTVTGTAFTGTVTLSAGANTVSVTITDTNQQTGSSSTTATASVTLQTAPVVVLTTVSGSGTTATFSGTVSDTTVTQATVIYNGQALKSIPVTTGSFSSFISGACGSPTLAVSATNGAGTGTSSTQTVSGLNACANGGGGGGGSSSGGSSSSSSSSSSSASSTVGSGGGTLASNDNSFSMTVPAGTLATGQSLSVSTSSSAPSGAPSLPTGFSAASSYITLSGGTLSQPVPASINFSAAAGQTVTVFADGAWHYVPTAVGQGSVKIYVSGPDTFVVLATSEQFGDVPSGYWAQGNIQTLAGAGIVAGFPDGSFQPDGTLTRAQFVKMLDLTLNLPTGGTATAFSDVSAGDWFTPYVAAAVQAGLVQGTSPTTFSPNATVTREQMAVLLQRALKLSGSATLSFGDAATIDGWATAGVQAAVSAGYLNGFPDGTFQPLGVTTRAQASKVLALVIAHLAPQS